VLEEIKHEVKAAITAYQVVLEMAPSNSQAVHALSGLYEEEEKWPALSELLLDRLSAPEEENLTAIRYRLGEINELYLNKKEDALTFYEQVLVEDANHLRAQEALERLLSVGALQFRAARILEKTYEAQGAAEQLARVLMIAVEEDGLDVAEQVSILTRVADLRERRLGDANGAFEVLARAFKLSPTDESNRSELRRVAEQNDFHGEFAEVLDAVIPHVTDDHALSAELISTVAKLYDEKLGDFTRAENAYRSLLELDPDNVETALPAILALERMLSAGESYAELLKVLRQKVRLVDDPDEKKGILHRMADIEESVLSRIDNAIGIFNEILELDDRDLKALSGLERLYEQKLEWGELIGVLRRRADVVTSTDERRSLLFRVAELFEQKIEDIDEAIAAYNQVNMEAGPDSGALSALANLYRQSRRWADLLEVYETEETIVTDVEARVALCYKMGDLLRTHLDDPERAVEKLGETLTLDPLHASARESLEAMLETGSRRQVIDLLKPVYESEANYSQILKCDEILAAEIDDPFEKAVILRRAAGVAESGLGDATKAFELLGRAFRSGAASSDMVGDIVNDLERLSEQVDGTVKLVELYREVTPDILDGELQIKCYLRVAEIAHKEFADMDLARDYYVKVLDIDGENFEAMDSLEIIYESAGQFVDLFEIYRRKVQRIVDPAQREEILFKQAKVCEENLDDISGAISTYESILDASPENEDAMAALERLYPKAELWADLMNLLETRAEVVPEGKADILYQLGTLAKEKLGDEERALEYFRSVLDENPSHEGTLSALETAMADDGRRGRVAAILEPFYKRNGDWAKLVNALEARLEYSDDLEERKQLLLQMGTRYEEQLDDLESAFETFARLFKEDIEDISSREVLTRLASVLEIWPRLAEVYASVLDDVMGDTPTTAELAFVLGDIYERLLSRLDDAIVVYKRALAFNPDNEKAFLAVERVLLATESWAELLALYRDAADQTLDMDKRKAFVFKIADIQEGPRKDLDAAITAYSDVLELDARDEKAISALDRLYRQAERFDDLAMHLRMQVESADDPVERNNLRCRLGKVYEENLSDLISAVDVYEEALADEGGGIKEPLAALEKLILEEDQRERISGILEPVYRDTDEWKKLIVILQTKVEYIHNPAEKAAVWKEVAALHYKRGQNYLLSFQSLGEAFRADPSDRLVLEEIAKLAEKIEEWDVFATMLSEVVEEIYDLEIRREVLQLLGATYDQRLDIPRKAIESYRGVLEIDESDNDALSALEGLYNLVGDWDGLVGVLDAKANFADDPLERAEILRTKASIHEDLMSSPEDAIEAYRQAMDADPISTITMDALERLYEEGQNWHELVEIRRQRVEVTEDTDQRLEILRSIADVLENKIDDSMDAISVWRDVLDEASEDSAAILALDRLFTKESLFVELLENLELQRTLAKDQALRVDICNRIGQIQEREMGNMEGAIESYRDVLLEQPTHKGAIEALTRLAEHESVREQAIEVLEPIHREAERYEELVAIIELKMEIIGDAPQRLEELVGLAKLHESGRSDPKAAFDVYARALAEDPSRVDVMDNLERIAEAEALWKKLSAVYMDRADNVYDASAEWALLKRVGQIRETRLKDISGAIDAYRRALDSGSIDIDVLVALDRLYEAESMWPELDEILDREIEMAESVEAANTFKLRQGDLRSREFEDVAGAIMVLREVIESEPINAGAQSALEALLIRDEFVEDLVEILTPVYEMHGEKEKIGTLFEHRLRVAGSDSDKVHLFKELALHHESVTEDLNAAFDAYLNAFRLDPGEVSLLDELERLAESLGAWTALVESVDAVAARDELDPMSAVELGLKVAGWASMKVGDPVKAESMYRKVLERDPNHMEALSALESLLKGLGNFEALLPVMQQRADAEYDYAAKKQLYMEIADIARRELHDVKAAKEAYLEVRGLDEADADALDALIVIAEEEEDFDAQVNYLVARSDFTVDPVASNQFLHRAASLYLGALDDPDQAVEMYRRVIEKDALDKEAAKQLMALFEKQERYGELREFMMDQLSLEDDEQERVETLKALAELDEKRFSAPDDAIGHLNEILLVRPDDTEVAASLKRLYHQTERWHDLVDLLEAQVDQAKEKWDTDTELALLVETGELLDAKLDDTERATEIYERVLERDSEHTRALAALSRLYEANEEWEKCAEVLNTAARAGRGGPDEAEVHYRLARLYQKQMGDDESAVTELNLAVKLDSKHQAANQALLEHCRAIGDLEGVLAALIREEAYLEEMDAKVAKLMEIANLQMVEIGDKNGAVKSLERAKELVPTDTTVLLKLSDAYIQDGREQEAIPVIEALIDAETEGGRKRTKQAAVYHQRLATAYISQGDQTKGLEHLEAAYKLDIANVEVLLQLGRLYYEQEAFDQAVKLFRALLLQRLDPALGIAKADIYYYVGDISLRQGDPRKAKGMFRRGLDEDPHHEGCKNGLSQC
jgi:golgin subfamily B member 1